MLGFVFLRGLEWPVVGWTGEVGICGNVAGICGNVAGICCDLVGICGNVAGMAT